jgi:hypothetical protein
MAITNTSDRTYKFVTERIETVFKLSKPFLFRSRYSQSDDWRMNDLRATSRRVIISDSTPVYKVSCLLTQNMGGYIAFIIAHLNRIPRNSSSASFGPCNYKGGYSDQSLRTPIFASTKLPATSRMSGHSRNNPGRRNDIACSKQNVV